MSDPTRSLRPLGAAFLLAFAILPARTALRAGPSASAHDPLSVQSLLQAKGGPLDVLVERAARTTEPDCWTWAWRMWTQERMDLARRIAGAAPEADRDALLAALAGAPEPTGAGTRMWAAVEETATEVLAETAQEEGQAWLLTQACVPLEVDAWELPPRAMVAAGLEAARSLHWRRGEKRLALLLSEIEIENGAWDAARRAVESVLALADPNAPEALDGSALQRQGRCLVRLGDTHGAGRAFRLAAQAYRRAGDPIRAVYAHSSAGSTLLMRGQFGDAFRMHGEALAQLPPDGEVAAAVRREIQWRIAAVYELCGMHHEALALLEPERVPSEDRGAKGAIALGNLSRLEFLLGDLDDALATLKQAEDLWSAQPAHKQEFARARALRGWMSAGTPHADSVLADIRRLSKAAWGDARVSVLLHEAMGRISWKAGDLVGARKSYARALEAVGELPPDALAHRYIPASFGAVLSASGQHRDALRQIDSVVRTNVGAVTGMQMGSSRTFIGISMAEGLAAGVHSAATLGDLRALWRYLEAGRGIRLLAALGGRSRLDEARVPNALQEALRRAQAEELAARARYRAARAKSGTPATRSRQLKEEVDKRGSERARIALNIAQERTRQEAGELSSAAAILPLRRVAAHLEKGSALVTFSLAPEQDRILAMVVAPSGERVVRMKGKAQLLEACKRSAWTNPGNPEKPDAAAEAVLRELRKLLVRPLGLKSSIDTLYIVPDGALAYLPYAALFQKRDVVLVPSGTVLARLSPQRRRTGTIGLALGAPEYTATALQEQLRSAALLVPEASRASYLELEPLPATASEAIRAAGPTGIPLVGSHATATELRKQLAKLGRTRLRTLHFGCHGIVHADSPALSGLALTDGLLKAHDILGMRINTDLVVLAACETATDPFLSGEGISGLVRSFFHAGAPRVLATLWKIPDETSAELMKWFYEELDKPGTTVAGALRTAQKRMSDKRPAPYYWAAWTLWGLP